MNISREIQNQISKTKSLFWIGSIISGILLGLSAPGFGTNWAGILGFFPLLAVLDQLHKNRLFSFQKRAGLFFCSLLVFRKYCCFDRWILDY
jgi:apolipoprotein N-acyltransferase